MMWTIPGTVLQIPKEEADRVEDTFSAMFLAGGISLGQVSAITGLEPYTVQNWVKRGLLSPPREKRYTLRQLCRIITVNMLKGVLPMERVCGMLGYINGRLDNEEDDVIDDSKLFFMFVRLAARARELADRQERQTLPQKIMADYQEPIPGAKQRVETVLQIMLTAWIAGQVRQEAEKLLDRIETEQNQTDKENVYEP